MDKEEIRKKCSGEISLMEAVEIHETCFWEDETQNWSPVELAVMQLQQPRLVIPFPVFHKAVSDVLDRDVWTHEFAEPAELFDEMEFKLEETYHKTIEEVIKTEGRHAIAAGRIENA